jgi:hypothetical protein
MGGRRVFRQEIGQDQVIGNAKLTCGASLFSEKNLQTRQLGDMFPRPYLLADGFTMLMTMPGGLCDGPSACSFHSALFILF